MNAEEAAKAIATMLRLDQSDTDAVRSIVDQIDLPAAKESTLQRYFG